MKLETFRECLTPEARSDLAEILDECASHEQLNAGRFCVRLASYLREPSFPALPFNDLSLADLDFLQDVFFVHGEARLADQDHEMGLIYLQLSQVMLLRGLHARREAWALDALLR